MTVVAIVPAAGRGERLGADLPKALAPVGGVAMVARAVDGLRSSRVVDAVVVVAPSGREDEMRAARGVGGSDVTVVTGGVDRVGSVAAALDVVPGDTDVVLVHDAARCLCPPAVVRAVVEAVRTGHPAVVPVLAVADTLKRVDADRRIVATVDRTGHVGVQTPQGFAPDLLRRAHERARTRREARRAVPATDDAGLVEDLGETVVTVPGDPRAFKVTTALDLAMAEALVLAGPAGSVVARSPSGTGVPGCASGTGG